MMFRYNASGTEGAAATLKATSGKCFTVLSITGNRVVGEPFLGISFGPGIQVYYLIAAWCFACMIAMFAFTHTPLGRIANAVRDNPERAEFIGYNTHRVRFFVLIVSAFFAGIAGALSALNFEIVTAENVSAIRSGGVLLATVIGGASLFFGPTWVQRSSSCFPWRCRTTPGPGSSTSACSS